MCRLTYERFGTGRFLWTVLATVELKRFYLTKFKNKTHLNPTAMSVVITIERYQKSCLFEHIGEDEADSRPPAGLPDF